MTTRQKIELALRPGSPPIVWGKPNSPLRSLCAMCHGALPQVPFMLWKSDGSCASFCDGCVERHFEFTP